MTSFYNGKQVLILGGAGFLASHLEPKLLEAGANAYLADNFSRGRKRDDCINADVSDVPEMRMIISYYKPDIIFNLAAWVAGVIYNQKNHGEMFTKNLAVQSAPLQVAAELGVERFVQVSSACVYSPEHNHPAIECNGHKGEPVAANIGYSLAKRMGERLAVWAHQELDLHTVIVRPSNLVGERDYFDERAHVVPALIRKCYEQDPIQFYGTGEEVREFLYAGDCADGLMAAGEHGRAGEAYNLGTGGASAVTIRRLFDIILELTLADISHKKIQIIEQDHDAGDPARWSCERRASEDLGWCAETTLIEMLERTVKWYNEQH